MATTRRRHRSPNIVLIGIDSLRRDHLSCYGYPRLTTPHIDRFAQDGTLFENTISAFIPTTSAYASMLTGMDVFSTKSSPAPQRRVASRSPHPGRNPQRPRATTPPASVSAAIPVSRGFDNYLDYEGWGSWNEGRRPKAENLNAVALPELDRLAKQRDPFFLFLRHMDPHAPVSAARAV